MPDGFVVTHPQEKRDCTIARVPSFGPNTALHSLFRHVPTPKGRFTYKNAGNRQNLTFCCMNHKNQCKMTGFSH